MKQNRFRVTLTLLSPSQIVTKYVWSFGGRGVDEQRNSCQKHPRPSVVLCQWRIMYRVRKFYWWRKDRSEIEL